MFRTNRLFRRPVSLLTMSRERCELRLLKANKSPFSLSRKNTGSVGSVSGASMAQRLTATWDKSLPSSQPKTSAGSGSRTVWGRCRRFAGTTAPVTRRVSPEAGHNENVFGRPIRSTRRRTIHPRIGLRFEDLLMRLTHN